MYKGYEAGKEKETNEGMALAKVGKIKCRYGKCKNWGHKSAQCSQKNNNTQQTHHQNLYQKRQASRRLYDARL